MRVAALGVALSWGCGADECLEPLPACDPLYEPTFAEVHARTLTTTCAAGGCHDAATARGGMALQELDAAYAALVDDGWVVPGDPECSEVVRRLYAEDATAMPPGSPLDEAERCAIQRWIADGAAR